MATSLSAWVAVFVVLLAFAQADDASGKASVTVDVSGQVHSLIQRKSVRSLVTTEEAESVLEEPLQAHIVCHSDGCAEVQAKLAVLANKTAAASLALEDCGTHRQKLSEDLDAASAARGQAEADLAACAEEREKLAADLDQCGQDRQAAEAELAECADERAVLEAELSQCADVDRPAAEAELEKCGEERKKLEKELEELSEAAKSTRRRRRKRSLAQTDAQVHEAEEATHEVETEQAHEARQTRVLQRLTELAQEADIIEERMEALDNRIMETMGKFKESDAKAFKAVDKIQKINLREQKVIKEIDTMTDKLTAAQGLLVQSEEMVGKVKTDLAIVEQGVQVAATDMLTESANAAAAVTTLLQLNWDMHDLRQREATLALGERNQAITDLKKKLEEQLARGDDAEACDVTRAKLIEDEGALAVVQGKLDECMAAKAVIQQKLAAVEQAREKAEKGLAECEENKKKLQASLDECLARKEEAKTKLQECLDRKKELKEKIEKCKAAKDEANRKLEECLKRKDELKAKIKKLKLVQGSSHAASLIASGHVDATLGFATMLQELREHIRRDGEIIEEFAISEHAETMDMKDMIREVHLGSEAEYGATEAIIKEGESEKAAKSQSGKLRSVIEEVGGLIEDIEAVTSQAKAAAETSVSAAKSV